MNQDNSRPDNDQLAVLDEVLRRVSRASRLTIQDEEDFTQSVHVKLLERNYDIFRQFSGRCSLRTYLTVIVKRQLLDWRISLYGKWRPSATAARLGEFAVRLEQLIHRDGFGIAEAVSIVAGRDGAPSGGELHQLAIQLPNRIRRSHVPEEGLHEIHVTPFEDPIDASYRDRLDRRARRALALAIRGLAEQDRRLVCLRYRHGRSIQSIARSLQLEPKALYRRYERVLRELRRSVTATLASEPIISRTRGALAGPRRIAVQQLKQLGGAK